MPSQSDLDFLSETLRASPSPTAPQQPSNDLDFLSGVLTQAAPLVRQVKRQGLEAEREQARTAGARAGMVADVAGAAETGLRPFTTTIPSPIGEITVGDPVFTTVKGIAQAGQVAVGAAADIGLGAGHVLGLTDQPPNLENLRAALFSRDFFPGQTLLPLQRQLGEMPGLGARAAEAVLGIPQMIPTLAAGGVLTAATGGAAAPFLIYPALFGAETFGKTGDVHESLMSAAVGAIYPAAQKLTGPLSARIINRLGLADKPAAQRLVEQAVDQGIMQATTQAISLLDKRFWDMTPQERLETIVANSISILPFAIPRALGHAAGAPSEYQRVIAEEASKMRDSIRIQAEEEARTAARTETAGQLRSIRATTRGRRTAERVAEEEGVNVTHGTIGGLTDELVQMRQRGEVRPANLSAVPRELHARVQMVASTIERGALQSQLSELLQGLIASGQTREDAVRNLRLAVGADAPSGLQQPAPSAVAVPGTSPTAPQVDRPVVQPSSTVTPKPPELPPTVGTSVKPGDRVPAEEMDAEGFKTAVAAQAFADSLPVGSLVTRFDGSVFEKWSDGTWIHDNTYQLEGNLTKNQGTTDGGALHKGTVLRVGKAIVTPKPPEAPAGGTPSAPTIPGDQTKPAPAGQVVERSEADSGRDVQQAPPGQPGGTVVSPAGQAPQVQPVAAPKPPVTPTPPPLPARERITLPKNTIVELPEIQLESMSEFGDGHTGRFFGAKLAFNPGRPYISLRGPLARTSYKIPFSELPAGSWAKTAEGGLTVDKQAILDFLRDDVKRFTNREQTGNARHFLSADITDLWKAKKGRKKAGTPKSQVTLPPAALERVAPKATTPVPRQHQMDVYTRAAWENLLKQNFDLAIQIIRRQPEELGDVFWAGIREEINKMQEYADDPRRVDHLVRSLRALKETGGDYFEWEGILSDVYGPRQAAAAAADNIANLENARVLIEDPNVRLAPEARAMLRDILNSPVARYLDGGGLKMRITDSLDPMYGPGKAAIYDPATTMLNFVRSAEDPTIYAHEFFHPLWEILQPQDRRSVKRWRDAAIDAALVGRSGKDLADLTLLRSRDGISTQEFLGLGIDRQWYRLRSAGEFFAYMMTERFQKDRLGIWNRSKEILAAQNSFLERIRKILAVIFDAIRQRVPGLRTQADILQRTILDGKYEVVPKEAQRGNIPGEVLVTRNAVITAPGAQRRLIRGEEREPQGALESAEKVESYVRPLEPVHTPERYRAMADVINRGLVPEATAERYFTLPMPVALALRDVFPYRIETQRVTAAGSPPSFSFRQIMQDTTRTPEDRSSTAGHALTEFFIYQGNAYDVRKQYVKTGLDIDEAARTLMVTTPERNEAEVFSTNLLGNILDRIKTERERTAEGAQINERIREGMDNIDRFRMLLVQQDAAVRALVGIANLAGRTELLAARPEPGAILDLIAASSGFPGLSASTGLTERQWISQLSAHLNRLEDAQGNRRVNASGEIIEGTLYALRQLEDARQALLEARLTGDGTLRRFRASFLEDLRARVPRGFNTILGEYAHAKVESDALRSAFRRLNDKVETLTEQREHLRQAVEFLDQHESNADFKDFGKAVAEYTGAVELQYTERGPVIDYPNPLTGERVLINYTFDKGDAVDNIRKRQALAEAGLEYAARPNADPFKAAGWVEFAQQTDDYNLVASPHSDVLADPWANPLRWITKSKFGLIVETTLSRIPGGLAQKNSRDMEAFATANKAKNRLQKDTAAKVLGANIEAWRTHPDLTFARWQHEVAALIIDSRQHYGQTEYRAGQRIIGFGHLITPADMKAVKAQYEYEQYLRKLREKVGSQVLAEAPAKIKEEVKRSEEEGPGQPPKRQIQRFALSRGPGTVTRSIPERSRVLAVQWKEALKVPIEEGGVNEFLSAGDNFIRIVLGHVREDERIYVLLGKGDFANDYRAFRLEQQGLQASGNMPANLNALSQWLADHHNAHLREGEPPVTAGDVRKELVLQISDFMRRIELDTEEKANAARIDIVSYENGFTQPRGAKIAPGTLYESGLPDMAAMQTKGNDAVEFYAIRHRDSLVKLNKALLIERTKLTEKMALDYGGTGPVARWKLDKGIRAGTDTALQRHQLELVEVDQNLARVAHHLNNIQEIVKRREAFFGDDIANRTFSPWLGFAVGSVLMRPRTWMTNFGGGSVMWAMKTAELRRGGWLLAPPRVAKAFVKSAMLGILAKFVPKNEKQRLIKKYLEDNPGLIDAHAAILTDIQREILDRESLRRLGVIDAFSIRDYVGWDSDRPVLQNLKVALDTLRNVNERPGVTMTKEVFSYLGMIPRVGQILTRKIGMRWADNWINMLSTQVANGLIVDLRVRAIKSFDARLEIDPIFRELYRESGDDFLRFSIALTGQGTGQLLTPAELTGRLLGADKAAIQMRRSFSKNNDAVDLIMLRYWWNKRHARGDRNAPFMTDVQRLSLMFGLAEDVNMGTLASRANWWDGSREKQWLGVLSQYWLWQTDRLGDLIAKPRRGPGKRTYAVRYVPGVIGFLAVSALSAIFSVSLGQRVNDALFNTASQKPDFWDSLDDDTWLKVLASTTASYWGAVGSIYAMLSDTPGKLGYKNPFFFANVVGDLIGIAVKGWQSGDVGGPTLDFMAKYFPWAQVAINRLPSREGLVDVRNSANALRAATPPDLEAKRRQPSTGSDFRASPMTPLYNTILNAAMQGDWSMAQEAWDKAVAQQRALGNADPESAILSAIRTRTPEAAVFQRVLTPEERTRVYNRLTPERRQELERVNDVFGQLAERYGRQAGGPRGAATPRAGIRIGAASVGTIGDGVRTPGLPRLSLGLPRGVRSGFRTRSLRRGLRTRRLLRGGLRRTRRSRLRRLAA